MEFNPLLVLGLVSFVFNAFLAVYVYVSNRQAAKDNELQDTKQRITTVEERVRNMPQPQQLAQLEGDMRELKAQLQAVNHSINTVQRGVSRINDYLLDSKK